MNINLTLKNIRILQLFYNQTKNFSLLFFAIKKLLSFFLLSAKKFLQPNTFLLYSYESIEHSQAKIRTFFKKAKNIGTFPS